MTGCKHEFDEENRCVYCGCYQCPSLPNWMVRKDGRCKRYFLCLSVKGRICVARGQA